jgi:hypothetical protein
MCPLCHIFGFNRSNDLSPRLNYSLILTYSGGQGCVLQDSKALGLVNLLSQLSWPTSVLSSLRTHSTSLPRKPRHKHITYDKRNFINFILLFSALADTPWQLKSSSSSRQIKLR